VPSQGAVVGVSRGVDDVGLHQQTDERQHTAVRGERYGGSPGGEAHQPARPDAGQDHRQAESGGRELEQHTDPDDQRECGLSARPACSRTPLTVFRAHVLPNPQAALTTAYARPTPKAAQAQRLPGHPRIDARNVITSKTYAVPAGTDPGHR
jgi:hypothetical protein